MEKLKKLFDYVPLLIVLLVAFFAFVTGAYLDRDIAEAVNAPNTFLSIFFTAFGMIPTLAIAVFASTNLLILPARSTKTRTVLLRGFAILSILLITFFEFNSLDSLNDIPVIKENLSSSLMVVLRALYVIIINGLAVLFTILKHEKFDSKKLIATSIVILFIAYGYAGATEAIKYLASRPRPSVVLGGVEEFRAWYQFKPFYALKGGHDGCKSFVSGHGANSACLISLLPLFLSLLPIGQKKHTKLVSVLIAVVFVLLTCASRMTARAHFLTDLSGGVMLSVIVQIVILAVVPKIIDKVNKK